MTPPDADPGPWTLRTERLLLRPWRVADASVQHELWGERDPRVPARRRLDAEGRPTVADLEAGIGAADPARRRLLAVERIDAGDLIGYCGVIDPPPGSSDDPQLAFELLRRTWGHGYATEAARAVLERATSAGYRQLSATVWEWNVASRRVLAKLGFAETHREQDLRHGVNLVLSRRLDRDPSIASTASRIRLGPLTAADAEAHCAGEDELTVRWLIGGYGSIEGTTAYFAWLAGNAARGAGKRGFGVWLEDRLAGYVDVSPDVDDGLEPGDVNLSYAVHPWARGRGVAAAAVALACDVIRREHIGTRAALRIEPANTASVRVAEKAGFGYVREFVSGTDTDPEGRPVTMALHVLEL